MRTKNLNQFRVIASNLQTATRLLLPDIFSTFNKCQTFVEKMNNKYLETPVVFTATKNLAGISKRQLEVVFQNANISYYKDE